MNGTPPNTQDADQLRLLSIFHYIAAGLAALFACLPVIHLVLGIFMVACPEKMGGPKNPPPAFLGWFFIIFAACFIAAGWAFAACLLAAGRCLSKHRHYMYCMVMAGIGCMFVPFGTVLGVFTIIALMRPSVKALFGVPT
ncbi:MAG: hypothetical protein FJ395_10995 [Verrucomicrobia bacterium]|nr:hypothetical protein [Verrucomicrobiota bacterium]